MLRYIVSSSTTGVAWKSPGRTCCPRLGSLGPAIGSSPVSQLQACSSRAALSRLMSGGSISCRPRRRRAWAKPRPPDRRPRHGSAVNQRPPSASRRISRGPRPRGPGLPGPAFRESIRVAEPYRSASMMWRAEVCRAALAVELPTSGRHRRRSARPRPLPQRRRGRSNRGNKSSKVKQDCTICHSCR